MTYRIVFDISERFPEMYLEVLAFACAIVVGVLLVRYRFRAVPYKLSCFFCVASSILWVVVSQLSTGGSGGFPLALIPAAFPVVFAVLAWTDRRIRNGRRPQGDEDEFVPARRIAPFIALLMFLWVGVQGFPQWQAFDLARQQASGDVTVVSGPVTDFSSHDWTAECFTVEGHRYCYKDGPNDIGFHQTALNGGPVREGLEVRVTSIGSDIVRLEVANP